MSGPPAPFRVAPIDAPLSPPPEAIDDEAIETIERDMDRDRFMSAEEAMAYGIIDKVFYPAGREPGPVAV